MSPFYKDLVVVIEVSHDEEHDLVFPLGFLPSSLLSVRTCIFCPHFFFLTTHNFQKL